MVNFLANELQSEFLRAHKEFQKSTVFYILMVNIPFAIRFPVQADLADKAFFVADVMGDDAEGASLDLNLCLWE